MPWEDGIIKKAKISQLKFYIDFYFKMCGGVVYFIFKGISNTI